MNEKNNIKDVSQSTNIYEIVEVIQQLNPNAEIRLGDMRFDNMATERFYSSVPGDQLILPEGFYYNEKNGVTNKHKTQSGMYCTLHVKDLSLADENTLIPKVDQIISRRYPKTSEERQSIKEIIINAIQKLKNKILNKGDDSIVKAR